MGLEAILFLIASLLLVTSKVSSTDEKFLAEVPSPVKAMPPAQVPVKAPVPISPVQPPALSTPPYSQPPTKPKIECVPLCEDRCKLHSRKRVCMRACTTCCGRCKCVPPGTYGNREKCGKCYTDMTTRGGKFKCP